MIVDAAKHSWHRCKPTLVLKCPLGIPVNKSNDNLDVNGYIMRFLHADAVRSLISYESRPIE